MDSPLAAIGWEVLDRIRFGSDFAISPHGVGIAVGYILGSLWFARLGRRRGMSEGYMNAIVFWALVGALIGARFFWVVGHYSELDGFFDAFAVWRGGITLVGGIAGAVIATYPVVRRGGYGWFRTFDLAAVGIVFGIFIGRIGDLIIGDHLGKPTSWALAFTYEGGNLAGFACRGGVCTQTLLQGEQLLEVTRGGATLTDLTTGQVLQQGIGVHQTALYDFIHTPFLFLLLLWLARRGVRDGIISTTFFIWYGAGRLLTDFLRVDKQWFGLTGSQWTAAAVAAVSVVLLIKWAVESRRGPRAPAVTEPTTAFPPPPEPGRFPT